MGYKNDCFFDYEILESVVIFCYVSAWLGGGGLYMLLYISWGSFIKHGVIQELLGWIIPERMSLERKKR